MRPVPVMEREKPFHIIVNHNFKHGPKFKIFRATPFGSNQKPVQRQDCANNAPVSSYQNGVVVWRARKSVQIAKGGKEK